MGFLSLGVAWTSLVEAHLTNDSKLNSKLWLYVTRLTSKLQIPNLLSFFIAIIMLVMMTLLELQTDKNLVGIFQPSRTWEFNLEGREVGGPRFWVSIKKESTKDAVPHLEFRRYHSFLNALKFSKPENGHHFSWRLLFWPNCLFFRVESLIKVFLTVKVYFFPCCEGCK